ncbi:MAG: alpha/beta fold hydrolase, partial [Ramlibacter sp.]
MAISVTGPAGEIFVDDGGSGGLVVLFVHSFAGDARHWRAQLQHVRLRRRAIAIDLRGHGRSDAPASGDYSVPALAEDIAAVTDALGLKRFVLVGHSMGGAAATAYAGKHPDRLAGLVLAGTPGRAAHEQAQQIMGSLKADYDKVMAGYW